MTPRNCHDHSADDAANPEGCEHAIAVITVSDAEQRKGKIWRLLDSVPAEMNCVVVVRGIEVDALAAHPAVIKVLTTGPCGVSTARNIGLDWLSQQRISPEVVVFFPDDDGWYPPGYVATALDLLTSHDLLLGNYVEGGSVSVEGVAKLTRARIYRVGNSVGMALRWSLLKRVGKFDPVLGVGSGVVEAGEDLDLILRAITLAKSALFAPGLKFSHPRTTKPRPERAGAYLTVAVFDLPRLTSCFTLFKPIASSLLRRGGTPLRLWRSKIQQGLELRRGRARRCAF